MLILGKNWKNIAIISFLVVLITAIFTFIQPLKYRSTSKLLVVQEYNAEVDPYAASRSTQYLSNILVKVVQSSSFFEEVMKAGFNIEDNFGATQEKRQKNWIKTVSADAVSDSGIIVVNAYHSNPEQADQISRAVNFVLKSKNSMYHGWGDKVSVRTIEKPLASKYPVSPNVPLNFAFSIVFGLILGSSFVYLFPNAKIFHRKRKNKAPKADNEFAEINKEHKEKLENKEEASPKKDVFSEVDESIYSHDKPIEKMILNNYPKAEEKKEAAADNYSVEDLMEPKDLPAEDEEPNFSEPQGRQEDLNKHREILPRENENIDFEDGDMNQFVGK